MAEYDIHKRTLQFSKDLLLFVKKLPRTDENQILKKQIVRSGTSIGANVAESNGGHSKKDFANFMNVALKSANETKYWFELIVFMNQQLSKDAEVLMKEVSELSKIIATICVKARG
jgi:four helix bundle protein